MLRVRLASSAVPAILAALLVAPAAQANLLTNGSFEDGAFVDNGQSAMSVVPGSGAIIGWTVLTDTTAWIGAGNPWSLTASDGSFFLDLTDYADGAPFAGLQQNAFTLAGATYKLSFDLGASTSYGRPVTVTASAAGSSQSFSSPAEGGNNEWTTHAMSFVATSGLTAITLQGTAGSAYVGLDNVTLELVAPPVPEPGTWALMAAGLGWLGARRRSRG